MSCPRNHVSAASRTYVAMLGTVPPRGGSWPLALQHVEDMPHGRKDRIMGV